MPEARRRTSKETRASLEALRWLALPTRPGLFEDLSAIVGRDPADRPCQIQRQGQTYSFIGRDGRSRNVDPEEIMGLLLKREFRPERVELTRDLTHRLFRAAVRAAEAATIAELQAQQGMASLGAKDDESPIWFDAIMVWTDQDAVLPHALEAVVFSIATAEAQTNAWGGWTKDDPDDALSVDEKCRALARRAGIALALGDGPGAWFLRAVERRHEIVHARPVVQELPLLSKKIPRPASTEAQLARRACCGVRWVLVTLARGLNLELPRYLAMCPADANDVDVWRLAIIQTGMRDDPDFPAIRLKEP